MPLRTLRGDDPTPLAQLLAEREGWKLYGACRGLDPELFFGPELGEPKDIREIREHQARQVCRGCPVRQECLNAAAVRREKHGIWGGVLFPDEWRRLRRLALRSESGDLDGDWGDPAA